MKIFDDAFTARMWRLRLCCDGISTRLKFKHAGEALYCMATLLAAIKGHAKCRLKKIQLRKELLRVQDLGEDIARDKLELTHIQVRRSL